MASVKVFISDDTCIRSLAGEMHRKMEYWIGKFSKKYLLKLNQNEAPLVSSLRDHCAGALAKGTPLPHILLAGPSGMGKTELAKCLAQEMGTDCHDFYSSPQSKRWQLARHLA